MTCGPRRQISPTVLMPSSAPSSSRIVTSVEGSGRPNALKEYQYSFVPSFVSRTSDSRPTPADIQRPTDKRRTPWRGAGGGAAVALLLFLAHVVGSPAEGPLPANVVLIKWAFAVFGMGLFVASMTFVNAYVAQGAIASGQSNAFGNTMRRLGLSLIVVSLLLFLAGIALVVVAI